MKKLFAILLSVYILSLFTIPCSDVHDDICRNNHQEQTSNTPVSHQSESSADCCSPFCTCNCCASPVPAKIQPIQFQRFTYLTQEYIISNTSLNTFCVLFSIWQPPQAS